LRTSSRSMPRDHSSQSEASSCRVSRKKENYTAAPYGSKKKKKKGEQTFHEVPSVTRRAPFEKGREKKGLQYKKARENGKRKRCCIPQDREGRGKKSEKLLYDKRGWKKHDKRREKKKQQTLGIEEDGISSPRRFGRTYKKVRPRREKKGMNLRRKKRRNM